MHRASSFIRLGVLIFFYYYISVVCGDRYEFKSGKKVALKELGPRFTLKLRSLQKGTFDSKFGQYEWLHKVISFVCWISVFGRWMGMYMFMSKHS